MRNQNCHNVDGDVDSVHCEWVDSADRLNEDRSVDGAEVLAGKLEENVGSNRDQGSLEVGYSKDHSLEMLQNEEIMVKSRTAEEQFLKATVVNNNCEGVLDFLELELYLLFCETMLSEKHEGLARFFCSTPDQEPTGRLSRNCG